MQIAFLDAVFPFQILSLSHHITSLSHHKFHWCVASNLVNWPSCQMVYLSVAYTTASCFSKLFVMINKTELLPMNHTFSSTGACIGKPRNFNVLW